MIPQPTIIVIACILGMAVGSFLNVVIYRLPKIMEAGWNRDIADRLTTRYKLPSVPANYSLAYPPSACPYCGHQIKAIENIPIVSYLILGGRCSSCKTHISARYPMVEFITGVLAGLIAYKFGYGTTSLYAFFFVASLIALTLIDIDTMLLPDSITLPLLWVGLLFNIGIGLTDLRSAVLGAAIGYAFPWLVCWVFLFVTGRDGMGHGDFKLVAALGAWFGWQAIPSMVSIACALFILMWLLILVSGRSPARQIPFGPYLAASGVITLFFGVII